MPTTEKVLGAKALVAPPPPRSLRSQREGAGKEGVDGRK